jgi:hypothetical protein
MLRFAQHDKCGYPYQVQSYTILGEIRDFAARAGGFD